MSVQMIENWSEIEGAVRSILPESELDGFSGVEIEVERARAVEGFPHLLQDAEGSTLEVQFPQDLIAELAIAPGRRICARVRKAGLTRVFAHREHIDVEPERGA